VTALFVDTKPFFTDQRATHVALAAHHIPPSLLILADEVIQ